MSLIIRTFWKLCEKAVPRDGHISKQADEADDLEKVHHCLGTGLYPSDFSSHLGSDIRRGLGDRLLGAVVRASQLDSPVLSPLLEHFEQY